MIRTRTTAAMAVMLGTLLAAACAATPAASPLPSVAETSPTASATGAGGASPTASPSAEPSAAPSTTATATAEPTIEPRSGTWSEAQPVGDAACEAFTVAIDAEAGYHVAAQCEDGLVHLSSQTGDEWVAEPIPAPAEGRAIAPQVAIDDGWVYVGYTRVDFSGDTCSPDPYEELGVEVRSRQLSDGAWAEPTRIGDAGDELQSMRVVDTVIYATVSAGGAVSFVTNGEGPSPRIPIEGAISTSVRIGDDGRPRVGYSSGDGIHVGTVDGDTITSSHVAAPSADDLFAPALVLAPGDVSSIVWGQTVREEEGCGGPGSTAAGTFFATDETGDWAATRISERVGQTSLTLDLERNEAHVLLAAENEVEHLVRDADGDWSSSPLPEGGSNPVIRVDPASDALVAFVLVDGQIRMLRQE